METAIWLAEEEPRTRRFLDGINRANNLALQPEGAESSPATPDLMLIAFKAGSPHSGRRP